MRDLTPYDTGARLEPAVWVLPHIKRTAEHDLDAYGKVDLNNDEESTVATIYGERVEACYVLVVYSHHTDSEVRINLDADLDKIQARILGQITGQQYDGIINAIDAAKTDDHPLDSDEYASVVLEALGLTVESYADQFMSQGGTP
jgi:hypothetical protein